MNKSKIFLLMTVFLLALFAVGCSSSSGSESKENNQTENDKNSDEVYKKVKDKGVIEAGSTAAGPPFTFLNPETNEIEGVIIDIGKRVAEELDLELNINTVEFTSLVPSMDSGKIDMVVAGLARTDEREKVIDFSDTIYTYGEVIVIPKENNEIKSFEDLKGKKVGVQEASTNYEELKKHPEIEIQTYKSQQDMAKELGFGRIDAFMPDYPVYQNLVKESPELEDKFKFAPDHESEWLADIGLGVPKGSKEFLEDINEVIREMKDSGELDEIVAEWEI